MGTNLDAILARWNHLYVCYNDETSPDEVHIKNLFAASEAIRENDPPGLADLLDWAYDAPESMGDFNTFHGCPDLSCDLSTLFQIATCDDIV